MAQRLDKRPEAEQGSEDSLAVLVALRRDAILEAIAYSASVLLHSTDLRTSLQTIVERLGRATGVDRVHIFEVKPGTTSTVGVVAWHYVWSAPGIVTPREFAETPGSMAQVGLASWMPRLLRGETIVSHTRDLDEPNRKLFEMGNVKSVLSIPVFVDDQWWGMIGVDDCQSEREWLPTELAALTTLAELIGAAVARTRNLATLADANRIIENSPTILYRLSAEEPFALTFVSQNIELYGYDPKELMASPTRWAELIDAEHRPAIVASIKSIITGEKQRVTIEFRLIRPDGSRAWFEGHGYPVYEADRIAAIEGLITDITERKNFEQRLTFTNALLAAQLECSPDGILVVNEDARIASVNRPFLEMWHIPEELVGELEGPVLPTPPDDAPVLAFATSQTKNPDAFKSRVQFLYEHPDEEARDSLETTDGRFIDRHTKGMRDATGRYLGRIWFFRDVTVWKTAQDALRESEEKFRNIFGSVNDGIMIIDPETGNLIDINPPGCVMFGYTHDELVGANVAALFSAAQPFTQSTVMKWLSDMHANGPQTSEWHCRAKDGHLFWGEFSVRSAKFGSRYFALSTLRDITDRKRIEAEIVKMARHDGLTGLANRAVFLERLNLALARARRGTARFAILYLDIDHFKDVNDTLGHPVGDALLQAVAGRLRDCMRETDLVARFGGDEFAVLQEDITDATSTERLAIKIQQSLAVPYSIEGNQVRTTASIGIVPYSDDIEGDEAMMMKADLALYRAKDEGRNRFHFHAPELDQQVLDRVAMAEEIRLAIEREEFELYFQPQVDLTSGWIVGLEALLRWNHPTRGLLLPSVFIPIAETTGNILALGRSVIERTCRQIRNWGDQHIAPASVAVNLSAAQFRLESGLDRLVAENLAKYHVAPNQLELELTESVLMETTQKHRESFERLRGLGVRLAIDDFGTGYSSLDYLRSFCVSRLKIDRRFVEGITTDPNDATIVRATISLAHELGIEVVAEGVETAEQKQFLISAGCKVAQGYYLGEPMPVDRVTALLRKNVQFSAI